VLQAVKNKQHTTLSALLKQRANVNVRDGRGRTALIWAAWQSDAKAVNALLVHRANVNAQDNEGLFALWTATERGDIAISTGTEVGIVQQLLEHGANVDLKDKHGETIFSLIAQMERPDPKIVRLLRHARLRQHRNSDRKRRPNMRVRRMSPQTVLWRVKVHQADIHMTTVGLC